MADYTNVLSDRSWNDPNRTQEQNLAELSKRLEAEGYTPGTNEFNSYFYSIVNMVSGSTNSSMTGDKYASSTGNLALKNWMAENFTQEFANSIGVDVAGMTGFSPESGGYYSPGTGEFIAPNDPYQRNSDGSAVLDESGQPIRRDVYAVTEFYKNTYGRLPTQQEITDGIKSVSGMNISGTSSTSNTSTMSTFGPGSKGYDDRKSAYDLLYNEFDKYGLASLVEPLKGLITSGASPAEFTIKLRNSEPYKKRFAANASRVANGLTAISEAEYLSLEDQYQNIMRNYGLPASYYARGDMGTQEGFNKFIANDVSARELEDRIITAQSRVLNANPEVTQALKQFYPDITNGDILAYTLDPKNAIENIKRKVTTAEIGGAFLQAGLQTGLSRADELRAAGVTKDTAQQGAGTIAGGLQRGSQLAAIYGQDPYTQTTAETEVFNIAGAQEARKQRQKITGLEQATFGGQSGLSSGALVRDRAGAY